MKLAKNIGMNKYAIKLIEEKQLPYRSIYIFSSMELEISKAYIKTYLKTEFIYPFNSFADTPISFDN